MWLEVNLWCSQVMTSSGLDAPSSFSFSFTWFFFRYLSLTYIKKIISMLIYKESNINLLCFWPLYVMTFNGRMHFNWPSLLGVR